MGSRRQYGNRWHCGIVLIILPVVGISCGGTGERPGAVDKVFDEAAAIRLMAEGSTTERMFAVRQLGKHPDQVSADGCAALVAAVAEDTGPLLSSEAARALGLCRCVSEQAVDALIGALNSDNRFLREEAVEALGGLGEPANRAAPALAELLASGAATEQVAARSALEKLVPEAASAVLPLITSADPGVSDRARLILASYGAAIEPFLEAALAEAEEPGKQEAIQFVLDKMAGAAK